MATSSMIAMLSTYGHGNREEHCDHSDADHHDGSDVKHAGATYWCL